MEANTHKTYVLLDFSDFLKLASTNITNDELFYEKFFCKKQWNGYLILKNMFHFYQKCNSIFVANSDFFI